MARGSPASFGASLASLAAPFLRFAQLLPELVEGRDRVGLLLHVEVVDLLLAEVHDPAGEVVQGRLAFTFDGVGRDDALAERLAAEHPHHRAEHAFELDLALVAGLDVGERGGGGQGEQRAGDARRTSACATGTNSTTSFLGSPLGCPSILHVPSCETPKAEQLAGFVGTGPVSETVECAHANLRPSSHELPRHVHPSAEQDDCHGGHRARLSLQPCGQVGRFDLPLRRAVAGRQREHHGERRHQGPDQGHHRAHADDSDRGRLVARSGGGRHGLPEVGERLRGDERGLQRVLDEGSADADDGRRRRRAARRARRDFDDRRADRRRASRDPSGRLDQIAQPLQLRHSHRRHALSFRTGLAQRARQLGRRRRHQRADRSRPRQRDRVAEGRRHDARQRRQLAHLPSRRRVVPTDERRLPQVLQRRAAGAGDGHCRARRAASTSSRSRSSPRRRQARHRRRPPGEREPQRRDPRRRPRLCLRHARQYARDEG